MWKGEVRGQTPLPRLGAFAPRIRSAKVDAAVVPTINITEDAKKWTLPRCGRYRRR